MLNLTAGGYRLVIDPARGGSILSFDWRGQALMRPVCGPTIFDVACFPLVPFSNRIAFGIFEVGDRHVQLRPNFPGSDHPHPLHGFGWLSPWTVVEETGHSAVLEHHYPAGEWPWAYRAEQRFELSAEGLQMELDLTNLGPTNMPAGVGFHPYFPCNESTRYFGLHRGEWQNDADCLPLHLIERDEPSDWWAGERVDTRHVDTAYTDRQGSISITWPDRRLMIEILSSANLPFTVVFSPAGQNYLCIEPVTHMTDAVNRRDTNSGLVLLEPAATLSVNAMIAARHLA